MPRHFSQLNWFFASLLFAGVFLQASARGEERKALDTSPAATVARLLRDLKFLTSKECEGRGVYTKGIDLAADHIVEQLKAAGLKPGGVQGTWFQPFEISGTPKLGPDNRLAVTGPGGLLLTLNDKQFSPLALGGSGHVSAPLVFVGYGISSKEPAYDDYEGVDVAGKIVVILRRTPRSNDNAKMPNFAKNGRAAALNTKIGEAISRKAAGILLVNDQSDAEEDRFLRFNFGAGGGNDLKGAPPIAHIRRAVLDLMLTQAGTSLSKLEKKIDAEFQPQSLLLENLQCHLTTTIERPVTPAKNIIGVVEGSGPLADETVVIGAHYDHLGYGEYGSMEGPNAQGKIHFGADDNASGTTSVIELARRFAAQPNRQGRRLVFHLYSGEELGLLGSEHYVSKQPLFPLEKTAAMLNLDMVGRLRDKQLEVLGTPSAKEFSDLVDAANEKVKLQLSKPRGSMFFGASDHYSFYLKKIPVLFFFTKMHKEYHRPIDTWDTVNVEGMRQIVEFGEGVIERLATMPRPAFQGASGTPNTPPPDAVVSSAGDSRPRGPTLGITPSYSDEKEGVLLEGVRAGGPAEKAGLKSGDRILEIDGKPIKNLQAYMAVMKNFKTGDTLRIVILRDGAKVTLQAKLQ